jgi:2-C-methyl-D-erythritol 2,4-cyclodiphosphate synthase
MTPYSNLRIGYGFDVHRLGKNRELILGGVKIPAEKGCIAHSDGDVLIHAICDALLGAANLGDIGRHFPDSDPQYKNIDSTVLLSEVLRLLKNNGFEINNVDSTIGLQKPKISTFIDDIQNRLSALLEDTPVSVKATTTEKLGFVGREEGIAAYAVVLIHRTDE